MSPTVALITIAASIVCFLARLENRKLGCIVYCLWLVILTLLATFTPIFRK